MHSEATFVYVVTEAAYFTSHRSPTLVCSLPPSLVLSLSVSFCRSLSLSFSLGVPCHQSVMPSIPHASLHI